MFVERTHFSLLTTSWFVLAEAKWIFKKVDADDSKFITVREWFRAMKPMAEIIQEGVNPSVAFSRSGYFSSSPRPTSASLKAPEPHSVQKLRLGSTSPRASISQSSNFSRSRGYSNSTTAQMSPRTKANFVRLLNEQEQQDRFEILFF